MRVNYDGAERDSIGTSLQGYVDISYRELCEKLGDPIRTSGDKVQAEWVIDNHGDIATIYDYKEYGTPVEHVRDWHIGGRGEAAVELISELFPNAHVRGRGW